MVRLNPRFQFFIFKRKMQVLQKENIITVPACRNIDRAGISIDFFHYARYRTARQFYQFIIFILYRKFFDNNHGV